MLAEDGGNIGRSVNGQMLKRIGRNFRAYRNQMCASPAQFAYSLQIRADLYKKIENGNLNWESMKQFVPLWERLGYKFEELVK